MSRDPITQFLSQLQHPTLASIDLSLDRMMRLLTLLGDPHRRMPPVVHVAGTNGKGSTLAYLQAMFEAGGYRVHKYTSPHLVHFSERIILAGKEIDNAKLVSIVKHVASFLPQCPATFFEAATAVAFLAFAEKKADVLLLETGMGGRLDATNVIAKPLLTAITPIDMDHTEFLGNTLEEIAAEKAGIVKSGVPCVLGKQLENAKRVVVEKAGELNAPLYVYGEDWNCTLTDTGGRYQSETRELSFTPSLVGPHQLENAAMAIACLEKLSQFTLTDEQMQKGIASAIWPARIQKLSSGPYAAAVADHTLYVDGGHNPQGGRVLAEWLAQQSMDIYLVCGMMGSKNAEDYLAALQPYATALFSVPIPSEDKSYKPATLAECAQRVGIKAEACESVQKALQTIVARAKNPSLICICGSFYLAGFILEADTNGLAA